MKTNYKFYQKSKYTIFISSILIIAGIVSIVYHRIGTGEWFNYGIDFQSGTQVDVVIHAMEDEEVDADEVRALLEPLDIPGMQVIETIGSITSGSSSSFRVKYKTLYRQGSHPLTSSSNAGMEESSDAQGATDNAEAVDEELSSEDGFLEASDTIESDTIEEENVELLPEGEEVTEDAILEQGGISRAGMAVVTPQELLLPTLIEAFGEDNVEIVREQRFDKSVSSDTIWTYIVVSVLVIGLILIYLAMRFQFRYGLAAVITIVHDLSIIVGIISLFNFEMDTQVVVALLFTIGYSLNDTIVVFDRIRENAIDAGHNRFVHEVNRSISQSFSRTIITSLTTLLALAFIIVLAGADVFDLAFALIMGVIVGTYSSIFIASPIVVLWENMSYKKELEKQQKKSGAKAIAKKETPKKEEKAKEDKKSKPESTSTASSEKKDSKSTPATASSTESSTAGAASENKSNESATDTEKASTKSKKKTKGKSKSKSKTRSKRR